MAGPRASLHLPWLPLILLLGLGLRWKGVALGLPDFTDEAIPFRKAIALWNGDHLDLNPHFFNYPSFAIYLHLVAQWTHMCLGRLAGAYTGTEDYLLAYFVDPSPMVMLARVLGIVADLFTIAGAWFLGCRFGRLSGVIAATITAAAPIQVLTSTGIFVDSIATALTAWGMVFVFRYLDDERLSHLLAASAFFGLGVGTKYPAILALLPLVTEALLSRRRWHVIVAIGTVFVGFLLTTPYALIDSSTFLSDTAFELSHVRTGHFGAFGQSSHGILFGELWATLGPAGLLCLLGAFALSCRGWSRWRSMRPLLMYVTLVLVVLATARLSADRYAVQVVPFAAVLVGAFCQSVWNGSSVWRKPAARAIAAVVIGWPVVSGIQLQLQLRTPSQSRARDWCDQWIAPHAVILQEAYTIEARNPIEHFDLLTSRIYRRASRRWQERAQRLATRRTARVPLVSEGDVAMFVSDEASLGGEARIPVASPGARFCGAFYEPRLLASVDYVLTSSAVRGRYERDPIAYPRQRVFYRWLDQYAAMLAEFQGTAAMRDPTLRVYAVGDSLKRRILAETSPLNPKWWLAETRPSLRDSIGQVIALAVDGANGRGWSEAAKGIEALYRERVAPFSDPLASYFAQDGSPSLAREIAEASLLAWPGDGNAFRAYVASTSRMKSQDETRRDVGVMIEELSRRGMEAGALWGVLDQWEAVLRR